MCGAQYCCHGSKGPRVHVETVGATSHRHAPVVPVESDDSQHLNDSGKEKRKTMGAISLLALNDVQSGPLCPPGAALLVDPADGR